MKEIKFSKKLFGDEVIIVVYHNPKDKSSNLNEKKIKYMRRLLILDEI